MITKVVRRSCEGDGNLSLPQSPPAQVTQGRVLREQTASGVREFSTASWPFLDCAKMASMMRPDDVLETFSELAVKEPDLLRLVLQAAVAAMVNMQSVEAVDAELKRRAVAGN